MNRDPVLDAALDTVICFGAYRGKTLRHICKFSPGGADFLDRCYTHGHDLWPEVRQTIVFLVEHPSMYSWFLRKLGRHPMDALTEDAELRAKLEEQRRDHLVEIGHLCPHCGASWPEQAETRYEVRERCPDHGTILKKLSSFVCSDCDQSWADQTTERPCMRCEFSRVLEGNLVGRT